MALIFFLPTVEDLNRQPIEERKKFLVTLLRAYLHEDEINRKLLVKYIRLLLQAFEFTDEDLHRLLREAILREQHQTLPKTSSPIKLAAE